MSTIGSPLETSLLQAAQAQQVASKKKDSERATAESANRLKDLVDLKVAALEQADAIRRLPENDSEQAEDEARRKDQRRPTPAGDDEDRPSLDVTA